MNELIPQLTEYPQWSSVIGTVSFAVFIILALTTVWLSAPFADPEAKATAGGKGARTGYGFVVLATIAALVSTVSFLGHSRSVREANEEKVSQVEQLREKWVESHGVNIKKDTMESLDFPDTMPKADEEFGIAQVTKDKAVIDITLAWEDGDFVLYGTNGQPLERMEK